MATKTAYFRVALAATVVTPPTTAGTFQSLPDPRKSRFCNFETVGTITALFAVGAEFNNSGKGKTRVTG
jgi:hypothetical protein